MQNTHCVSIFSISTGEYSMLVKGAEAGLFDLRDVVLESVTAFKRAGAQIVITYFTPRILHWLRQEQFAKLN